MPKPFEVISFDFNDKQKTFFRIHIEDGELPIVMIAQKGKVIEFNISMDEIMAFGKFLNELK